VTGYRSSREDLLAGLSKGNGLAEREGVPAGSVAGDQDARRSTAHRRLAERGLCVIEKFVQPTGLRDEDFHMLGLTTHDEQLSVK
jgi:hypothetical protein